MKSQTNEAFVYVVHLCPSGEQPVAFRAAVRRVDCDTTECFTEAAALANYFLQQAGCGLMLQPDR